MKSAVVALVAALLVSGPTQAQQPAPSPNIHRCGNSVSDRPDPSCAAEQQLLNPDSSVKKTIPKTRSEKEQEAQDDARRRADEIEKERKIVDRKNALLVTRFPDQASHDTARRKTLSDVEKLIRLSETRIAALEKERRHIDEEKEFYLHKALPANLKTLDDQNETVLRAERVALANQRAERTRVEKKFDDDLATLRVLWAARKP